MRFVTFSLLSVFSFISASNPLEKHAKIYVFPISDNYTLNLVSEYEKVQPYTFEGFGEGKAVVLSDGNPYIHFTDMFSLDVIFHRRLLASKHRVFDLKLADYVLVPFYTARALKLHKYSSDFIIFFEKFLEKYPEITEFVPKHRVLLVGARADQDLCQSIYKVPAVQNMTIISLQTFYCKFRIGAHYIDAPYPSFIHLRDPQQDRQYPFPWQQIHPRQFLASFIGNAFNEMRKVLEKEMTGHPAMLWRSIPHSHLKLDGMSVNDIYELYRNTVYCPMPFGQSPARRAIFDAMFCGCIPVLFSNQTDFWMYKYGEYSEYAFSEVVDWDEFTLRFNFADVKNKGLAGLLSEVSAEKRQALLRGIEKYARMFQYSLFDDDEDAVGTLLRLLKRRAVADGIGEIRLH